MRRLAWLRAFVGISLAGTACSTWSGGPGVDNRGGGEAGSGGAGQEIGLVATPAVVSFDDAVVGLSYKTTVNLANEGLRDATIEWILPWVEPWARWSVDLGKWPIRLAPGESVELPVRYSPTEAGESSGELRIYTGASIEVVMSLSGRATLPPVANVPEELDFGAVEPGEVRTQSVAVRNVGTGLLKVTGASLSGNQFTLGEIEIPVALEAFEESGAQFEIPISYTPTFFCGGYEDFGTLTVELEGGVKPSIAVELHGRCSVIIEPPPP